MFATTIKKATSMKRLLPLACAALGALLSGAPQAPAPGIAGPTFSLAAQAAYQSQPDGLWVYSWGYGCTTAPAAGTFVPAMPSVTPFCNTMQVPGPTLVVTEGQAVSVTLTNNLPTSAGNTSILFPGFNVSASGGVQGLLTTEAAPGGTVTYTFTASSPGTRAYYSGTQGDLQVEMGLYGAIIVLPASVPAVCTNGLPTTNPGGNAAARTTWGESDFRLAAAAYDHPDTCYDREYLFQFSEMDPNVHIQALAQVTACAAPGAAPGCHLNVPTEPYHPVYFMINGRSMPDDMDSNYAAQYPHQPYNGNPHMHPGELVLLRIIGQGRWQHPFHEHGNHVRVLARDGNLIVSGLTGASASQLAGPLLFTTTTTPGQAMDGIFYWTGKGLNWDAYGHKPTSADPAARLGCKPDPNGYNTGTAVRTKINYYEWCQDHNKPLQAAPFGDVAGGGPTTLPAPNLFTHGAWYGGRPHPRPKAALGAPRAASTHPPPRASRVPPAGDAG